MDLHFHTPSSFDYKNKSVTNEQIISGLKKTGVDVVAITDHHVIDVPRITELQDLAGDKLTVLPAIEFRTELGGKEKVHLIGIFPENANVESLWTKLSGTLGLTAEDIEKKGGDESVYVDFREASDLIHTLGGIVTTHAGGKSNSIENIKNNAPFKMVLKKDLACECVDIYEVGKVADCKDYEEIVFPAIGKRLPLILGSDNHDITHYEVKATCWIKGDPSFCTFQQLIADPQRAFLGDIPEETARIDSNPTKYIAAIQYEKKANSELDEVWFSGSVELNPGLVAIIGNKGSGKTALAESIGLLGNCSSAHAFSFLSERKFRQARNNKAKEFDATLTWRNSYAVKRSLADPTDENAPPDVSYIPQSYLEEICNEVNNLPGGAFDKELKSVIFSHVPEDKKLGAATLDDLLEFQTEVLQQRLDALRLELSEINRNILDLEQRSSDTNRQMLLQLKAGKDRELAAHDSLTPAQVMKPEADKAQQAEMEAVSLKIAEVNRQRDALSEAVKVAGTNQRVAATRIASADRLMQHLRNFEATHRTLLVNIKADCDALGVDPQSLITLTINRKHITDAKVTAEKLAAEQAGIVVDSNARSENLRLEVDQLTKELDAPNSAYQHYLEALRVWTEKRESIVGSSEKRESLTFYDVGGSVLKKGILSGMARYPGLKPRLSYRFSWGSSPTLPPTDQSVDFLSIL